MQCDLGHSQDELPEEIAPGHRLVGFGDVRQLEGLPYDAA
jgi:hypothetical protein